MKRAVVSVECSVSASEKVFEYEIEELGCESVEEWNALSDDDQKARLQDLVNEEFDQPYWYTDNYNVKS